MNLVGAIEILKQHKHTTDKFKHSIGDKYVSDAIDTVVQELERTIPTVKQSDDKRLLLSAYLQGKRDQIYWATKWEELKPIGKYRIMKQFLSWYKTLKLKEIGE